MSAHEGALGAWLTERAATAARNGAEVHTSALGAAEAPPVPSSELESMRSQLEIARARAALQRDPAWLDELSDEERLAERRAAQKIRGMSRSRQLAAALSAARLARREQRVDERLARLELEDRVWSRRAEARWRRLSAASSRLASLQRTHVLTSGMLTGVAVAGVVWTSKGVHDNLVGPGGSVLAYIVEPLFSLPLIVIMMVAGRAALWGRRFPPPLLRWKVYALEAFLLLATIAVNIAGVVPLLGIWQGTTVLLAHLMPPLLIVVAVVLQPLVAGFLADILRDSLARASDSGPCRLTEDTKTILEMVARVRAAMERGQLQPWGETGLPSIESIRRFLACEKIKAQRVFDALEIVAGRGGWA